MLPFTSWIAMIATVASLEKVPNIYKSNSQSTYIYNSRNPNQYKTMLSEHMFNFNCIVCM